VAHRYEDIICTRRPAGELEANARRLKALLGCEHPR
jgi:hypothetical protein